MSEPIWMNMFRRKSCLRKAKMMPQEAHRRAQESRQRSYYCHFCNFYHLTGAGIRKRKAKP